MKRTDAGAPARLAALRDRAREAVAALPSPPQDVTRRLAAAPPSDPALAAGSEEGLVAACLDAGIDVGRASLAAAVRTSLARLEAAHPGRLIEVRVPPFGAVQVLEGPRHTRGTPPNVVETDAATWIALATGTEAWADAAASGRILASGTRADLAALLPLRP